MRARLSLIVGAAILVDFILSSGSAQTPAPRLASTPVIAGLDHVPVAVADLDAAAARYRQLGFVLKPGTPHENGIRNVHAKFPDGTEIELITAPEARDALTARYRALIAAGDGPAFLALFAPDTDGLAARLKTIEQPSYIFFGPRNHSPTDRPEHFAHPNGADSLIAVWLAADDLSAEQGLLNALGAATSDRDVYVPNRAHVLVAHINGHDIVLLQRSRQRIPNRRIVGVTLRVKSIEAVDRVLADAGLRTPPVRLQRAGTTSVFVPPDVAYGMWIEFREVRSARG